MQSSHSSKTSEDMLIEDVSDIVKCCRALVKLWLRSRRTFKLQLANIVCDELGVSGVPRWLFQIAGRQRWRKPSAKYSPCQCVTWIPNNIIQTYPHAVCAEKYEGPWFTTQIAISSALGLASFLVFSHCRTRWPLLFAPRTKLKGAHLSWFEICTWTHIR